ncbi:hypothetical protein [Candidatus Liberibacter asiaticus]|uniref:hypothetical protein n=1 Tax=Liberibacter asiaticus TaxID=34021 RepID=UPI001178CB83|nr:hypothetical protein [Candidatus Liberibacter asiaticus]KAE9510649.1 hypothetical protein FXW31_05580 [Candidatus Liberibacter asiaticus]KAE9512800.1 hypothetical protein FXW35_05540 [Candidatus Liberibacter asiaticus]
MQREPAQRPPTQPRRAKDSTERALRREEGASKMRQAPNPDDGAPRGWKALEARVVRGSAVNFMDFLDGCMLLLYRCNR